MTGPDAGITSTDPTREEGVMRALVVYESMFGNTQAVARAVAEGMSPRLATEVVEVGTAPATVDQDVSVLVVGAPTHGMTLSRPDTRESAARQSPKPLVSQGIGVREWLASAQLPAGLPVATFDTRVKPRIPGSAARTTQRHLRALGCHVIMPPKDFWVTWRPGYLRDGELDRARRWGAQVADAATRQQPRTTAG